MKSRLSSEKVMTFAHFSKPFCLVTDASKIACAGILLQNIDNQQKIIAVVSNTLTVTEQNWSATERKPTQFFLVSKNWMFLKRQPFCFAH